MVIMAKPVFYNHLLILHSEGSTKRLIGLYEIYIRLRAYRVSRLRRVNYRFFQTL